MKFSNVKSFRETDPGQPIASNACRETRFESDLGNAEPPRMRSGHGIRIGV